jgi:hypothetical protein
MFAFWSIALRLDEADACALQQELVEIYERYAKCKGQQRYVTHLAVAPWMFEETLV